MSTDLTARTVEALRPRADRYVVRDAHVSGLELRIHPDGAKVWTLRYRVNGQQRRLKLGTFREAGQGSGTPPRMTLAAARGRATKELRKVDTGLDPQAERQQARRAAEQAKVNTFEALAESYIERYAKPRKRSWKADDQLLRSRVLPKWKRRAVADITRRDVRALVNEIAESGAPITANRVVALLSKVFRFALDEDIIQASPAVRITRPGQERARTRVFTEAEIRTLWQKFGVLGPEMAAFFSLRLLTAQRGGEVASMRWQDLDLDAGWWTIPAEHSKNKLAHRVPLAAWALEMVKQLRAGVDMHLKAKKAAGKEVKEPTFVLAGARGKHQQREAAATFDVPDFRGHDLRRTAASLMTGGGVPRLVVGKILNHVEPGVTKVYDRHSYDAEKAAALTWWDTKLKAIVSDKPTKVLPFRKEA